MTQTQRVDSGGRGFWAYDVALGVFLKHLIDAAEPRRDEAPWLTEAIACWRVVACVSDYGLTIEPGWSDEQRTLFLVLLDEACAAISRRESIPAGEMASWRILEGEGLFARGAPEVHTAPVVELGRAIAALVRKELQAPPNGTEWLYGTPAGRLTL